MLVVAGAILGAVGGLVAIGNPVDRLDNAWHSFKGGYDDNTGSGSRLTSGLGSNRYDFYRVALDVFADHPVVGVGADNFFQDYLQRGESNETPRNPHNLALRTLAQTGIVGTLLLLTAFGAALAAGWRAMRDADPLSGAVAGGAVLAFLYWVVHGMTDWFWEWAGLGAPGFARCWGWPARSRHDVWGRPLARPLLCRRAAGRRPRRRRRGADPRRAGHRRSVEAERTSRRRAP